MSMGIGVRGRLLALGVVLVIWVAWAEPGGSQGSDVFYVSTTAMTPGASDDYSCDQARSLGTPRRTLVSALECLTAGDTLYVRGGSYVESIGDGETDYSGTSWANATRIAPYQGETVVIKAPIAASFAIQIGLRSYVVFDRITIDGAGVVHDAVKLNSTSHHIRFQNGTIANATHQGVNIQDNAHGHEIVNMSIHDNGISSLDHGIYIATSGNLVERSRIYGNTGYGVHVYNGACACANDNIVRSNRIYRNGYRSEGFGLVLGSGSGNLAYNNVVHRNRGGIQVAHNAPTDTRVYNNTLFENGNWGGLVVQGEAISTQVKNNIIYRSEGADLVVGGSGMAAANNLVGIDPQFIDPGAADFRLQSTSPAINRGTPLQEVAVDFDGTPRPVGGAFDIGAYEYGGRAVPARPLNLRIRPD